MDENEKSTHSSCPSGEQLSQFFDDSSDTRIAAHVMSCEKCQETLASYEQIQQLQREYTLPPPDFSKRIAAHCHQITVKTVVKKRIHWFPVCFRIAAAFVVLVGAVSIWEGFFGGENPIVAQATPPASGTVASITIPQEDVFSLNDQMRLQGVIDANSMQNVSTNSTINSAGTPRRKFRIGNQVEHIWMVENPAKASEKLQDLAEKLNCRFRQGHSGKSSGVQYQAVIGGTDKEIQAIVNELKGYNWVLMSPGYPQPLQENVVVFTGAPVRYALTILPLKED